MTHELKILPRWFKDVAQGLKNFEIRKNDRDYKVGDILILKEWDGEHYTGAFVERRVGYVYYGNGEYGVNEGYCILGLYPYNGTLKTTVGEWLDAQPCNVAVSQQAVLDIINERECHEEYCGNHCEGKCSSTCITIALANKVADLPSVTPIRPKGEWKCDHKIAYFQDRYVCSECGSEQYFTRDTITNFCPHCGADMRGKNNEND